MNQVSGDFISGICLGLVCVCVCLNVLCYVLITKGLQPYRCRIFFLSCTIVRTKEDLFVTPAVLFFVRSPSTCIADYSLPFAIYFCYVYDLGGLGRSGMCVVHRLRRGERAGFAASVQFGVMVQAVKALGVWFGTCNTREVCFMCVFAGDCVSDVWI